MDPADEEDEEPGTVLSPGELDLSEKEGVEQLDEGRFVVSPDGTDPDVPAELTPDGADRAIRARADAESVGPGPDLERPTIRAWHEHALVESPCTYGYHVSVKAGGTVEHHALHSDDVSATFDDLLERFAGTVDAELPAGAVLGILLSDASVRVRYPVRTLESFLMAEGLSTDDSIGDLLDALREDDGVVFPPRPD